MGRCGGHGKAPKCFQKRAAKIRAWANRPKLYENSTETLRKLYETPVYQIIYLLYCITAVMGVFKILHIRE